MAATWRRLGALAGVLALTGSLVGCPPTTDYLRLNNVPYHPTDNADLVVGSWSDLEGLALPEGASDRVVDVFRTDPAPPAGAPVIVYVPGGAWVHHDQSRLPSGLVRYIERGWTVLTVGYTKADGADPATQWPLQGQEIDWVVRWVKANAAALGVDDDKVVLAGQSAGAHLSAMVATARFDGPAGNPVLPPSAPGDPALSSISSKTQALVLLAGAYNLTAAGVPFSDGAPALNIPPHWPQQYLLGCNAAVDPPNSVFPELTTCSQARLDDASVVHAGVDFEAAHGNFPPTLMVHAEDDGIAPFLPNTFHLGVQLCHNDYPQPGGGTDRVPVSVELLAGSADHEVGTFDFAKLDYFLYRQGLLDEVPLATTTWNCNQ